MIAEQALENFTFEIDKVFSSLRSERLQFIENLTEDIRKHLEIEKRFQEKLREKIIKD
jgi:hypothetical protein